MLFKEPRGEVGEEVFLLHRFYLASRKLEIQLVHHEGQVHHGVRGLYCGHFAVRQNAEEETIEHVILLSSFINFELFLSVVLTLLMLYL